MQPIYIVACDRSTRFQIPQKNLACFTQWPLVLVLNMWEVLLFSVRATAYCPIWCRLLVRFVILRFCLTPARYVGWYCLPSVHWYIAIDSFLETLLYYDHPTLCSSRNCRPRFEVVATIGQSAMRWYSQQDHYIHDHNSSRVVAWMGLATNLCDKWIFAVVAVLFPHYWKWWTERAHWWHSWEWSETRSTRTRSKCATTERTAPATGDNNPILVVACKWFVPIHPVWIPGVPKFRHRQWV